METGFLGNLGDLTTGIILLIILGLYLLPFIAIIVFFVMAYHVAKIRKKMDELISNQHFINSRLNDIKQEIKEGNTPKPKS